jgi:rhodanese-related sulfurtransferase
MSIQKVTPEHARKLIEAGAELIDIRDADEHARERIPDAKLVPIGTIGQTALPTAGANAVIFHCRSGNRTSANAEKLRSAVGCDAYLLEGGIDGWKRAGLSVITDKKQPLELLRQVQITAGLLVLAGVLLGSTVSGAFYFVAGFVGAGLMFAGLTGSCALARVLQLMPWNRRMA